jgi:hypothetical protein
LCRSLLVGFGLALLWGPLCSQSVAEDSGSFPEPTLRIVRDAAGGFHATATLRLPGSPAAVRAVLTNYEEWPALFAGRVRIVQLQRHRDRVVTDLMIRRSPLPGELRLLCETTVGPDGGLVTTLLDGDFRHYARRWTFQAESEDPRSAGPASPATRATMDLSMELATAVPDWIVEYNLRRQLLEHFRILREKLLTAPSP